MQPIWFDCQHEMTELRKRVVARGVIHHVRQCLVCGDSVGSAQKQHPSIQPPPFDEDLHTLVQNERSNYWRDRQEAVRTEWFKGYSEYLASDQWKQRRAKVLRRANNICEGCATRPATQVHHLTYDRVQHEMLFDLVAVCDECHEFIHRNKEKQT